MVLIEVPCSLAHKDLEITCSHLRITTHASGGVRVVLKDTSS